MLEDALPAAEPASVAEAKAFLRIGHAEEDALIAGLIRTARALCEAFTGRRLIARELSETMIVGPEWTRLRATPVAAIVAAARITDGAVVPLAADAFATDIDASGDGWVRVPGGEARLRVTYRAGMAADWNGVPEPLRQGILRLVAHLHAHRDAAGDAGPPAAVAALWRPWRRMRLR